MFRRKKKKEEIHISFRPADKPQIENIPGDRMYQTYYREGIFTCIYLSASNGRTIVYSLKKSNENKTSPRLLPVVLQINDGCCMITSDKDGLNIYIGEFGPFYISRRSLGENPIRMRIDSVMDGELRNYGTER